MSLEFLMPNKLGPSLKLWREWKGEMTRGEVIKRSQNLPDGPLLPSFLAKFEKFGRVNSEKLFGTILPAYGIDSIQKLDLFLDFCQHTSGSIAEIPADGHKNDVVVVRGGKGGGWIKNELGSYEDLNVPPETLGSHRTRVTVVKVGANGARQIATGARKWQNHDGHEFVYVTKGEIVAYIGKNNYKLKGGDGIAFRSYLHHRFANESDQQAEYVVARPTECSQVSGEEYG